jgi:SsrA-binding protein
MTSVLAENRRARFDYEILETFEAGIELKGFEVKAIKSGKVSLGGSFALPRVTKKGTTELWLTNADVAPYQPGNTPAEYDSKRPRRLLLKQEETKELLGKIKASNLTLVPIEMYNKRGLVKVLLGLARHKKKQDKRETIQKRETKREISRTLKRNNAQ